MDLTLKQSVKTLILESVNPWKNYKNRVSSRGSQGARAPISAHATTNVYSQLWGLEDVGFNDFIQNACIPEGDGQVESGSASLPDPVVLETESAICPAQEPAAESSTPETLPASFSLRALAAAWRVLLLFLGMGPTLR